jgi:hypothetical protein
MGAIFISYRRDDSAGYAGRLYGRLTARFVSKRIFMDVHAIDPGVDFVEAIKREMADCDVVVAVIGRDWLGSTDKLGRRRLDQSDDYVRSEIEAALAADIPIVPVLVDGAEMPHPDELPTSISAFARRNAIAVGHQTFDDSLRVLIAAVEKHVASRASTPSMVGPVKPEVLQRPTNVFAEQAEILQARLTEAEKDVGGRSGAILAHIARAALSHPNFLKPPVEGDVLARLRKVCKIPESDRVLGAFTNPKLPAFAQTTLVLSSKGLYVRDTLISK